MAAVTIHSDFGAQENKVCYCFRCFPISLPCEAAVILRFTFGRIHCSTHSQTLEHSCGPPLKTTSWCGSWFSQSYNQEQMKGSTIVESCSLFKPNLRSDTPHWCCILLVRVESVGLAQQSRRGMSTRRMWSLEVILEAAHHRDSFWSEMDSTRFADRLDFEKKG